MVLLTSSCTPTSCTQVPAFVVLSRQRHSRVLSLMFLLRALDKANKSAAKQQAKQEKKNAKEEKRLSKSKSTSKTRRESEQEEEDRLALWQPPATTVVDHMHADFPRHDGDDGGIAAAAEGGTVATSAGVPESLVHISSFAVHVDFPHADDVHVAVLDAPPPARAQVVGAPPTRSVGIYVAPADIFPPAARAMDSGHAAYPEAGSLKSRTLEASFPSTHRAVADVGDSDRGDSAAWSNDRGDEPTAIAAASWRDDQGHHGSGGSGVKDGTHAAAFVVERGHTVVTADLDVSDSSVGSPAPAAGDVLGVAPLSPLSPNGGSGSSDGHNSSDDHNAVDYSDGGGNASGAMETAIAKKRSDAASAAAAAASARAIAQKRLGRLSGEGGGGRASWAAGKTASSSKSEVVVQQQQPAAAASRAVPHSQPNSSSSPQDEPSTQAHNAPAQGNGERGKSGSGGGSGGGSSGGGGSDGVRRQGSDRGGLVSPRPLSPRSVNLHEIFLRADTSHDGTVSRAELIHDLRHVSTAFSLHCIRPSV
jgi:hypothetical protein